MKVLWIAGLAVVLLSEGAIAVGGVESVEAVRVAQESVEEQREEADRLFNLGIEQFSVSQFHEALASWEMALEIYREIGDRLGESASLGNLGNAYHVLGEYELTIDFHLQSLYIDRETGDRQGEEASLGGLGNAYYSLGQYEQAIDFYQQSLAIAREIGNRQGKTNSLVNLGNAYYSLGLHERAIDFYQQALVIQKEIGNRQGQAHSLNNLGNAYHVLGEYEQAIDFHQQSLAIAREIGSRQTHSLVNLGNVYYSLALYERAIDFYQQALPRQKEIGDRQGETHSLNNLGNAYYSLGQYEQAINYYQQSLAIAREIGNREGKARSLNNLALTLKNTNQRKLAIALYKASINTYEVIRGNIHQRPLEEQEAFAEKVSIAYESLTDLLLDRNRILEAQRVLDLLRVQELNEFLRNTRGNPNTATGIALLEPEQRLITLFNERLANNNLDGFWDSPEVSAIAAELQTASEYATLPDLQNIRSQIPDENAAILQPLLLDNRLEIVLSLPNRDPIRATANIPRADLNRLILDARRAIVNRDADPQPALKKLYDTLIQPIRDELDNANIDTLVYSPDGALRYIPLAALHDGESYLIENFAVNHITAISLTDLNATAAANPDILAGAFVNGDYSIDIDGTIYDYSGLPAAEEEVKRIEELFEKTQSFWDTDFSQEELEPRMGGANILHLATHAQFVPGVPFHSFVLFGDGGRASFENLREWELPNTDLVVLSACETGLDGLIRGESGIEIIGFSYLMQEAGADATVSSLWRVSDSSTGRLMSAFYDRLQGGDSKSEALRQAQLSLVYSDRDWNDPEEVGRCSFCTPANVEEGDRIGNDHPYYWAPFILIGNGL